MIQKKGDYTFVTTMFGKDKPLNLTMSAAPAIDDEGIITLQMDGLFVAPKTLEEKFDFKLLGHDAFPVMPQLNQREQFWIHQDTLNSLFKDAAPDMFPYTYNNAQVNKHLNDSFPEVANVFGPDVTLMAKADWSPVNKEGPIDVTKKDGIRFQNSFLNVDLIASNATVVNKTVATFEIIMNADINFTMDNFVFHGSLPKVEVQRARLSSHEIEIYDRDFKDFFSKVTFNLVNDFNAKYAKGISIG
jgi:hypothetical protein